MDCHISFVGAVHGSPEGSMEVSWGVSWCGARRNASRPASSRNGGEWRSVRRCRRRTGEHEARTAGLDFAGNGARRYEDIGGGGEPIRLMVMWSQWMEIPLKSVRVERQSVRKNEGEREGETERKTEIMTNNKGDKQTEMKSVRKECNGFWQDGQIKGKIWNTRTEMAVCSDW